MPQWIATLLASSAGFMPHGHCYLWIPSLLMLHVGSDLLIGLAYAGISTVLWVLVRRLRLPFSPVFIAFGLFIGLCGLTHFMQIWTVWNPDYWVDGLVKGATAAASVATAVGLLFVKPKVEEVVHAARLSEERRVRLESAHAELEALYSKVKEMNELKSQFFANISHELRTPLALILGPARQMMDDDNLTPTQRRRLQSMHDNAKALLKQVNDLLDVAKLEAGKMSLHYAQLDLAAWVRRVASAFDVVGEQRDITLSLHTPPVLPAQVDPDKLERVLINLLSNAFKFTPEGGAVTVEARQVKDDVVIWVADTGQGIPTELHEVIFERFRQVEGGATRTHGGTGLGLAIVKEFVEMHGGHVSVSARPGGGSLFTVVLPSRAPAGVDVSQGPEASSADVRVALEATLHELTPASLHGGERRESMPGAPQVLVAEDNAEMRDFVVEALGSGYGVTVAANGEEALDRAEALMPDLIVTDVMMPRMSGDQLVAELRRRPRFDGTPVLLLTAKADDELRVRLLESGAQDYLTKPFLPTELRARAANLIKAKRAGDMLRDELASMSTDLEDLARQIGIKSRHLRTALDAAEVAREQAEKSSQTKTYFLGMLSHEMRTPLSTLQLNLQLLGREGGESASAARKGQLDRMNRAARQLYTLIEGLLEYTRVESGRLAFRMEPVDLGQLARDTVDEHRLHMTGEGVDIVWAAPAAGGPVVVHSDSRLLKVVLSNLVGNAVKFTKQGTITVRVDARGDDCLMEVHDTGIGIPPDALDRIFLPFEQVEPLQRKSIPGVGLGLTLVRQIVETLGGTIKVDSQVDVGTTFTVLLPMRLKEAASAEALASDDDLSQYGI